MPWIVRAIWEEHLGWFRYESSTELYDVPPQALSLLIWSRLAGGAAPVLSARRDYLRRERPLEALHLAEAVLAGRAPAIEDALALKLAAHRD